MTAEAGHIASRSYFDRNGCFHLNGAAFFDSSENDIQTKLDALNALSTAELAFLDGITAGTVTASKALVVDASLNLAGMGKIQFTGAGTTVGAAAARAVILGVGTSANPCTSTSTTAEFLEFRCKATAAAGNTARGMRLALECSAGACGEAGRFVTTTSADGVAGGTHGIHSSLAFGASAGNIDNDTVAAALRGTVQIPNRTLNGCIGALYGEFYSEGASSDLRGASLPAWILLQNTGNSTGMATVETTGYFLGMQGFTAGSGKVFQTGNNAGTVAGNLTASLKCNIGGVAYYIPLATAIA